MDEDDRKSAVGRDALELLQRLLRTGGLQGLPIHPRHLDAMLAIASGGFARQRPYAEWEINEALRNWPVAVDAGATLDRVPVRTGRAQGRLRQFDSRPSLSRSVRSAAPRVGWAACYGATRWVA